MLAGVVPAENRNGCSQSVTFPLFSRGQLPALNPFRFVNLVGYHERTRPQECIELSFRLRRIPRPLDVAAFKVENRVLGVMLLNLALFDNRTSCHR